MQLIRTFIGLELDDSTRAALLRQVRRLREIAPRVKWVAPENLHLTLKFLGELPANDLQPVFTAVQEVVTAAEPFVVDLESLGCFPNERFPRVVWAGCGSGAEALVGLARRLEDACAALGYDREKRPFSPHLTLGRVRDPQDGRDLGPAVEADRDVAFGAIDVDEIVVFMSDLRRDGPVYSPMQRVRLGKTPGGR